MAQAFAAALKDNNLIVTQATAPNTAPPESKFKKMLDAVSANPDSDAGTVNTIKALFESYDEDIKANLSQSQQKEIWQAMGLQRDKHTISVVESAVDDLIGDDAMATEYREILKQKVLHELNHHADYADAREKYKQFEVDTKAIKKCAKVEIEKFNKARGITPQSKPATGMKNNDLNDTRTLASASGQSTGTDGMTQKQRDYYNARLGTAQRMGWDRNSDKAKEFALTGAQRIKG